MDTEHQEGCGARQRVNILKAKYFDVRRMPFSNLPVFFHRQKILAAIEAHPVTVIVGATGSGKSTQVPALTLQDNIQRQGKYCNIIVTQPRRMAAFSLAEQVCASWRWPLGSICGYQIAMDKVCSDDCSLMYVTVNILVQTLLFNRSSTPFTHIIIDEIHERTVETDLLLYLLKHHPPRTADGTIPKLIFMSATLETSHFFDYFGRENCVEIEVEGRQFQVDEKYLDDLPRELVDGFDKDLKFPAVDLHYPLQNYVAISELVEFIDHEDSSSKQKKAILIFMPGVPEIRGVVRALERIRESHRLVVYPLYAKLPHLQIKQAFQIPPSGHRKVIVATNIAETSVTIPDVCFVIDSCLVRQGVRDSITSLTTFVTLRNSKASCAQRAGRAGRVQNGRVYRLVTKDLYDTFEEYTKPSILTDSLEIVVLSIKLIGLDDPIRVLSDFITPPDIAAVRLSILRLKVSQGLLLEHKGVPSSTDGDLSILGSTILKLPINPALTKLILLGFAFDCFEECVKIAACLERGSLLESMCGEQRVSVRSRIKHYEYITHRTGPHHSDAILMMNIFDDYLRQKQLVGDCEHELQNWAVKHGLRARRLSEIFRLYEELRARLRHFGFREKERHSRIPEDPSIRDMFLMIALCGSSYPEYYIHKADCGLEKEEDKGFPEHVNFMNTVAVTGLPERYAPLYEAAIRAALADYIKSPISFRWLGMDAFLSFGDFNVPGGSSYGSSQIPIDVNLCVRYLFLMEALKVPEIPTEVAESIMEKMGFPARTEEDADRSVASDPNMMYQFVLRDPLPAQALPEGPHFDGTLSRWHPDDLFTVFVVESSRQESLQQMREEIARIVDEGGLQKQDMQQLKQHAVVLVQIPGDRGVYRGRVVWCPPEDLRGPRSVTVYLIDDGLTISTDSVYELPQTATLCWSQAPFAVRVQLAHVQSPDRRLVPSRCRYDHYTGKACRVQPLSIVDEIMRVEIFILNEVGTVISINEQIVHDGFAVRKEERKRGPLNESLGKVQKIVVDCLPTDYLRTITLESTTWLSLVGPFSPLDRSCEFVPLQRALADRWPANSFHSEMTYLLFESNSQNPRFIVEHGAGRHLCHDQLAPSHITLVSDIDMILPFVSLAFAPRATYRTNAEETAYIGATCTLGLDRAVVSADEPEPASGAGPDLDAEDINLTFTHEMSYRDGLLINRVRALLREAFGGRRDHFEWGDLPIREIRAELRKTVIAFFNTNRKRRPAKPLQRKSAQQKSPDQDHPKNFYPEKNDFKERTLFRPHPLPVLRNEACSNLLTLLIDFKQAISHKGSETLIACCPLCLVVCVSSEEILEHCVTPEHEHLERTLRA